MALPDPRHAPVHPVPYHKTVEQPAHAGQLAVVLVEIIRTVKDTEIVVDPGLLDVCALPRPLDGRGLKTIRPRAIGTERRAVREAFLKRKQNALIEDKPFEIDPLAVDQNFHPGMDDASGCQRENQLWHNATLQALVDGETMKPAGDVQRPEQRHQERALGVALPISVRQHPGGSQRIVAVVSEKDFVPDEFIGRADACDGVKRRPPALGDQCLDRIGSKIEYGGFGEVFLGHGSLWFQRPN